MPAKPWALPQGTRGMPHPVTLLLSVLCGAVGAGLCFGFRWLLSSLQQLLMGPPGPYVAVGAQMTLAARLWVPCFGGLVAGLLLLVLGRLTHGERPINFMEAITLGDGQIRLRPVLARCCASLATLASGGAIGTEGPMVQLAAAGTSQVGRKCGLNAAGCRLLVACGVAAGMASAYRAPLAGTLFVCEVVLCSWSSRLMGPVAVSAVVATWVGRAITAGDVQPLYSTIGYALGSAWDLAAHLVLGLVAGAVGPLFLSLCQGAKVVFANMVGSLMLRLALGGIGVGLLAQYDIAVLGNGYSVVMHLLTKPGSVADVGSILALKTLAVLLTVGSGAVGGIFTPTLVVGSATGIMVGYTWTAVAWAPVGHMGSFALVGMGAMLASTIRAPLMAIVMIFEMTFDYDMVAPLVLACLSAHQVAQKIGKPSVYQQELAHARVSAGARHSLKNRAK